MFPQCVRLLTACSVLLMATAPAMATNGMNMIGYNVRASGMGGADVAIDSDCSGTACNPATLGRYRDHSLGVGVSLLLPELGSGPDYSGAALAGEDQIFPLPYLAYARKVSETSPWTLGVDMFAQGGMGVEFRNFATPAGPVSYDSLVRYGRLTGAASYRLNERLSLGFGAMVGLAGMEFSLFPELPGGIRVEDLSGFGYAGRLGLHYRVNEQISLGAQYTTEAALDLDGGTLTANFGPAGNGFFDVAMDNFTWPQEAELGIALQATPRLLLAADLKWIGWSRAIDLVRVIPSGGPGGFPPPATPGSDALLFAMNWDDQWVSAVGLEYMLTGGHHLRLGYNYGKSPVPDTNLSPLFPAIVEHHLTVGYGITLGQWAVDLAYEHAFENTQTNHNPDPLVNPFGPGMSVSQSQDTVHCAVTFFF